MDRAAAFAATRPGVPRRVVLWAVAAAAVLTLGGVLGEHYLSDAGLNPIAGTTGGTTGPGAAPAPTPGSPAPAGPQLGATSAATMGVETTSRAAPPIALADQHGRPFSLSAERGRVVVVSFFSAACDDICPVLEQEIVGADADLGALASRVVFVTVNTDPLAPGPATGSAAATAAGIDRLANWYLLSGSIQALDAVWRSYGVTIDVSRTTGTMAHNEVMYFVDPAGRLRFRATPSAEESAAGAYSLPPALVRSWAAGIASYAARLAQVRP